MNIDIDSSTKSLIIFFLLVHKIIHIITIYVAPHVLDILTKYYQRYEYFRVTKLSPFFWRKDVQRIYHLFTSIIVAYLSIQLFFYLFWNYLLQIDWFVYFVLYGDPRLVGAALFTIYALIVWYVFRGFL